MQDPVHNFQPPSAVQLPAVQPTAVHSTAVATAVVQPPALQSADAKTSIDAFSAYPRVGRNLVNDTPHRLIKRYSNRKLYDTEASRYITLLEVAQLVLEGAPIQVVDNATREDKTELTFAQIILEQLKSAAPDGTRSRLTEIIRECQRVRNAIPTPSQPPTGRETESLAPPATDPNSYGDLPWRERFESKLALLPPSQAAGLRAHWQDLSNRLMELQHQLTAETENRDPTTSTLE